MCHADDRIQRRAQLMANGLQEGALGVVGAGCRGAGRRELRFQFGDACAVRIDSIAGGLERLFRRCRSLLAPVEPLEPLASVSLCARSASAVQGRFTRRRQVRRYATSTADAAMLPGTDCKTPAQPQAAAPSRIGTLISNEVRQCVMANERSPLAWIDFGCDSGCTSPGLPRLEPPRIPAPCAAIRSFLQTSPFLGRGL